MVIILSRDTALYSTQVIVSAFEAAEYEVRVLDVFQLEVKIGRGVYLRGEKLEPAIVIPRFSGGVLLAGLAVVREWEDQCVRVLNSSFSLAIAGDQLATLQCLSRAGLPIPETSFCSQPNDEQTFSSIIGNEPKVIKLLDSSQGKGVTLADNPATAKSLLSTLSVLRSSGITQHYHAESKGGDVRILVLNGKVIAAIKRQSKEGDFRANVHQGGRVMDYEPTKKEVEIALKASAALGLTFSGVDLIHAEQGPLVLEVNASPGLEGIEKGERGSVAHCLPEFFSSVILQGDY